MSTFEQMYFRNGHSFKGMAQTEQTLQFQQGDSWVCANSNCQAEIIVVPAANCTMAIVPDVPVAAP
jgi:hypothetical protein